MLFRSDPYDLILEPTTDSLSASSSGALLKMYIKQGGKTLADTFYNGKKLSFYRETAAGAKDSTFNPATADFSGWTIANGEVSRSFSSGDGILANRTVTIQYKHFLPDELYTSFVGQLSF